MVQLVNNIFIKILNIHNFLLTYKYKNKKLCPKMGGCKCLEISHCLH